MSEFKSMFQETAEESGFALIEQGEYEAELTDCKLDLTKEPARLTFVYQITNDERYEGRKLFGNYQLEGRGIGFLKKDLAQLGLDYSSIGSPEDIAQLVWDNMPMPVVIFVNQKPYEGKVYNNVYLNGLLDVPAHETTRAPSPTNQKEADRQAAKKPATKTAPPSGKQAASKGKPVKNHAPQGKGKKRPSDDEPNFEDSDEVPF